MNTHTIVFCVVFLPPTITLLSLQMQCSALKRHRGVSKKMNVHRSQIGGRDSTVITAGKQDEREAAARERHHAATRGEFSFQRPSFWVRIFTKFTDLHDEDHQAIVHMDIMMHGTADNVEAVDNTVALGEEGIIETSHEGGEFEVFENLASEIALSTGSCIHPFIFVKVLTHFFSYNYC